MGTLIARCTLIVALVASAACSSGPSADDDAASFAKKIDEYRADVDRMMRSNDSPIPADKRSALLPLKYYPADPSFTVPAALRLADQRPVFEMPTSTGVVRRMQRVGVLQFTLKGQEMTLGAFVEEGTQRIDELFVPFADETTGKDTYEAGRYLQLKPTTTNLYEVDFNRAFNPYCAYNKTYECPFPPPSNRLKIAVTAGEKLPGA
jgi:uncharacterized protein (DUF1684 family)